MKKHIVLMGLLAITTSLCARSRMTDEQKDAREANKNIFKNYRNIESMHFKHINFEGKKEKQPVAVPHNLQDSVEQVNTALNNFDNDLQGVLDNSENNNEFVEAWDKKAKRRQARKERKKKMKQEGKDGEHKKHRKHGKKQKHKEAEEGDSWFSVWTDNTETETTENE